MTARFGKAKVPADGRNTLRRFGLEKTMQPKKPDPGANPWVGSRDRPIIPAYRTLSIALGRLDGGIWPVFGHLYITVGYCGAAVVPPSEWCTERLILRPWRESDLDAFARLNDDPAVMEFLPQRLSRDESDAMAARIRQDMERRGWGLWAVEVREAEDRTGVPFIGYVGLSVPSFDAHFTPCVEIGWRLAREHWGCGYASEAAAASLRFGFDTLNLKQIVSFTVPLNKRSLRVMERIGMTRDPASDFQHPRLSPGHPMRSHVLYRINRR